MAAIDAGMSAFGTMDDIARGDTLIHHLDPRAKLLVTLCFVVAVVSVPKYEVAVLVPFFFFPIFTMRMGAIPACFIAKRMFLAMPFALAIGIFNPVLDRESILCIGGTEMSGGWVSFLSILIKSSLTVSSALVLLSSTGIQRICTALEHLRVPDVFIVQILFLYRYLHVLGEEAARMHRAARMRSGKTERLAPSAYGHMIGHLLLRTLNRAERVHLAMRCRGFNGSIPRDSHLKMKGADIAFTLSWIATFILLRQNNVARSIGVALLECSR